MHRNLRLLLLAALALGLIAPIPAQAAVFTNVNGGNTIITGSSDGAGATGHHVMNFPGNGTLTCNSINLQGTASNKEFAEMTMTAGYAGCTFLGKLATINMQGCDYLFRANGGFKIASSVEKNCATEPMEIIVTGCTITLGEQEFASGLVYHPHAAEEATMEMKLTKLSWKAVGASCLAPGAFANGEYTTGNTIFTGESDDGKQTMKPFGMDTP
jgi:hypothetical protein